MYISIMSIQLGKVALKRWASLGFSLQNGPLLVVCVYCSLRAFLFLVSALRMVFVVSALSSWTSVPLSNRSCTGVLALLIHHGMLSRDESWTSANEPRTFSHQHAGL